MVFYHQKGSISQNFIKDVSLVRQLLSLSSVNKQDVVLEIGPGRGMITGVLSDNSSRVVAIEKDALLYNKLLLQFHGKNVSVLHQDFLKFELPNYSYKIFSNIPFSITSEIINKILKSKFKPEDIYFVMQKEAAEKYLGNGIESLGSVLVKPWYQMDILRNIDRSCFTPKPQIDIVFARFLLRQTPLIKNEDLSSYRDFVYYGFSRWQPTVAEAYKSIFSYSQIKILNKKYHIKNTKPSNLSFDSWLDLFKTYQLYVTEDKKRLIRGFENKHLKKTA